ncbi:disease resistance protein RPM1-like [Tripterygium wilfordii]|uniref:disease resistance protein RPM1-like n=1 Tax=Tripterygium wilfordii TaxID=458696 RepID=UPI0018F82614|nr:disease resistance protein RPM1-like [Tripterygium wilfordii]
MAETIVNLIIDKLVTLLANELVLPRGVNEEVVNLKAELETIGAFLRDADMKAEKENVSEGVKMWVKEVRDVAFLIEDVLDEYTLHVAKRHDRNQFLACLHKISWILKNSRVCHKVASKFKDIKKRILEIKERSERYRFNSIEQGGLSNGARMSSWYDPRVRSLFIGEAEVVGIESPRSELIEKLVKGASRRTVISVVGMGGIGKTTLAKKVYDNQAVTEHFNSHAWITVSQSYSIEELLRTLIRQFLQEKREVTPSEIQIKNKDSLVDFLREYLQQQKYVVVFDDVWKTEFWGDIEHAFPENNTGSRVMLTTRIMDVAEFCKFHSLVHVHEVQSLPRDKALELLCNKAFQFEDHQQCPPELTELATYIVEKCEGLPLAIVAIGGVLSSKGKDISQWQNLCNILREELESNPQLVGIRKILSFSYHDLPYFLKSCFLFLGMFPEDHLIDCNKLTLQWIAEGFIIPKKGKMLEDVAKEYLTELVSRNLVQVTQVSKVGEINIGHVHDLMRETILSKIEELSFGHTLTDDINLLGSARRLSIQNNVGSNIVRKIKKSQIRSLLLFNVNEFQNSFLTSVVAKFKLVKMIDLEGAPLHSLPEEFGHLFNLRYLCLKNTKLKELPKSFAGLQNLETLDLRQSQVREISFELNRLQKLRHLRIFNEDYSVDFSMASLRGFKIHGGYGSLQDLQTLNYLEADHGVNLLIDLRKLTNLKKLGVTKLTRENGKDLCIAVEKMKQLEYLNVCSTSVDDVLDLQFISSPPQSLWHLTLRGPLQKLPDWIRALQNLTTIVLDWSGLADDSLRVLEDLLNLSSLCLRQAYDGQDLHFKEGGFQKLKLLKLLELKELKMVMICKGALPLLENLHIGCSQLMEVPSGIQYLRMLENLELYDMPKELIETLLPHCGKNNWMIAHVPVIWVNIKLQGRLHDSYTLQSLKMSEIATTTMPRMRRGRLGFGQWPNGSKYGGN